MSVPKSLFTTTMDSIATRYLKRVAPINQHQVAFELLMAQVSVAEGLLFSPRVSFRVVGENVVVGQLAYTFGLKNIEALLKEGGIEFVLWDQEVGYIENEEPRRKGVNPLVSSQVQSPHGRDFLASAEMGLRGWARWMHESDAKRIARLAAECTVRTPEQIGPRTIETVNQAYAAGSLADVGLPSTTPMNLLDRASVIKLASIADQAFSAGVMLDREADLLEETPLWSVLVHLTKNVPTPGGVLRGVERVLTIHHLPSIPELLRREVIKFADIVRIRELPQTKTFREWLWSREAPQDAGAVADEYLAAIDSKVDLKDRTWFKLARIAAVTLVGTAAGVVAGPGVGIAAGAAISGGISLADGFGLEKLLTRKDPRRFATEVLTPMIAKHEHPKTGMTRNQRKRDRQRRR